MQTAITTQQSNASSPATKSKFTFDQTSDFWSVGGGQGSPCPEVPLSERRYDGAKYFDDCEPWIL